MAEPAELQLVEAFEQLEALGARGTGRAGALPRLPAPADDALLEHLAKGLQAMQQSQSVERGTIRACHIARAVHELHAALALLQEWVVYEHDPPQ